MSYSELIRVYFERSVALQWYWTIYVIVIGGLLAFSSLRQRGDLLTVVLIAILYCCFAYKNLAAIREVTAQRLAVVQIIHETLSTDSPDTRMRQIIEPTLTGTDYDGVRNFHVVTDVLTLAAVCGMELRRRRFARGDHAPRPTMPGGAE